MRRHCPFVSSGAEYFIAFEISLRYDQGRFLGVYLEEMIHKNVEKHLIKGATCLVTWAGDSLSNNLGMERESLNMTK